MAEGEEPGDYISQRPDIHDCFFLVGTEKKERISTIKYFLANYSSYFRAMLLEIDMKEKNSKEDIVIPDHEPDVFKLMLSYVYGRHDIKFKDVNQGMRFHILVDKCLMPKLKQISTNYLMENCKASLCEVLECAVLLEIKEMQPRAKTIVEKETRALLSRPDFSNLHPAIIEFVLKQEGLNATEVELWRALVKWAKGQCGNRHEGSMIRKKIDGMIKHMKFLQMSSKEFAVEVVPTSILTPAETIAIFVSMATGKGNTLKEAQSKTRQEWSSPPVTCVLSFSAADTRIQPEYQNVQQNIDLNAGNWETCYEIVDLYSTKLKIVSIQLLECVIDLCDIIHSGAHHAFIVELFSMNENRQVPVAVATHRIPVLTLFSDEDVMDAQQCSVKPNITLPDDFVMEAERRYNICIRYSNGSSICHKVNSGCRYRDRTNKEAQICGYCKVELVYSNLANALIGGFNGVYNGLYSSAGSFTFLVVEP